MIKKNLKALQANHINLHKKLTAEFKATDWFFPTQSGDFTIRADNNTVIKGNSKDDPGKVLEIYPFHVDEATVLIGISDGQLLHELCKRKEKGHIVIVYESELSVLQFALTNYNFTKWIKDGSLLFVTEKENEELVSVISLIDSNFMIQDWVILVEPYAINKYSVYGKMIKKVQSIINQLRCNTGTVSSAGAIIAKNDIENIPYVIRHEGINALKGAFKDKPVILVSTGPSLSKNIWRLKEIQGKVIIVAVAQALRILLAYDIKPDFICTVDFGEVNMTHFEGLMDSDVPLVALNRTYAPLLKKWRGPKFIASTINPGLEDTIAGILDDRGQVEQGGSVAHFAFGFALHLGCDPLVFIGQDLALSEGLSHNPNADSAGKISIEDGVIKWVVDDPRSESLNKQAHSMGEAVFVPGYFNEPVLTNIGLASFITAFEDIIKRTAKDRTVINATEGGARIHGAGQMSLERVITKYIVSNSRIDKTPITEKIKLKDGYLQDIDKTRNVISADIQLLKDIISETDAGLKTNEELQKMATKKLSKNTFFEVLKRNETHSNKANELADKNPLVRLYIYGVARQIQSRSLKVKAKPNHLLKNKSDLLTRIERNRMILEAANTAAKELLESYIKTQDVLNQYMKNLDESVLTDKEIYNPSLDDAEKYFSAGNWARPYTDAILISDTDIISRCWEMRAGQVENMKKETEENSQLIEYNELVYMAQEAGRENDFESAYSYLEKACKIYPDKFQARWGLATALHHNKKFKEALGIYDSLVADFKDIERLRFERLLVLLDVDPEQGLSDMITFLSTSNDFQYFWRNVGKLYEAAENKTAARTAYQLYIDKFPADQEIKNKIKELEA